MKEVFKNQRILRQLLINIERKVSNAVIHAEEHTARDGTQSVVTEWRVGDQSGCMMLRASGVLASALYTGMDATLVNAGTDVVEGQMRIALNLYSSVHATDPVKTMHDSVIKRHHNCSSKTTVPRYL